MDLSLVSQWLGHVNLSTSLVYAYADTQHKREAIEKAMGGEHSGLTDTTLCTVDDDALLKKLYGMWNIIPKNLQPDSLAVSFQSFLKIRYTKFFAGKALWLKRFFAFLV